MADSIRSVLAPVVRWIEYDRLLLGVVLCLVSLVSWPSVKARGSVAQAEQGVRVLELGQPIERELKGGQSHSYQITLAAGQHVHVVVEQKGIDVVVKVFGPDGKQVVEVDSPNGTQGPELVPLVSETAGSYRLEISSPDKAAKAGRYEARLAELRTATQRDRDQIAAERTFAEGRSLSAQGTKASEEAAIKKFEGARQLFRALGDQGKEASSLAGIGSARYSLGELKQALESFDQALPLFRSAGDRREEASALSYMGEIYRLMGDRQKALEYHNQVLPMARALGDRMGEALTLNNIALVYDSLGEKQKALDHYHQALTLIRSLGDRGGEAIMLSNIGSVYKSMGEGQKALDYYNQALPMLRSAGNRRGEANVLDHLGSIYELLGEVQKALDHYNQALSLARAVGNRLGEASALNSLSGVYTSLGDWQKALDCHEQVLQLRRAAGDRAGEATTLQNIGVAYYSSGDRQKALEYFLQALPLLRAVGDRATEVTTLNNIGAVYLKSGESQKALDHCNQALPLSRIVGNRRGEAFTLYNIGRAYDSSGDKQKALDYGGQALALYRAIGYRQGEANTLTQIASTNRDLGNLAEARRQIEASLEIIESVRTKVASQQLRSSFLASAQDRYELYIDLLMQLHQKQPEERNDAAALQASERARARSLLELLTEANADIRQGVDPALLARERALQSQLNARAMAQTALLSVKHTAAQAEAVAKEVATTTAQLQEVGAQIRATSPHYAALTQPQPLTVAEIQKQVLDPDTLLLEYALGEKRSHLWAVTPSSIASYQLPPCAEIETAARKVYDLLTARQPRPGETEAQLRARTKAADTEYLTQASRLSQMLLSPVAEQLGSKRLLIVAPGALQYLPFAALPAPAVSGQATGEAQPLIVKHEIVNLPSASTLAMLRRELAGRQPATRAVAVLADPVFEPDDARVKLGLASKKSPGATQSQTAESTPSDLAASSVLERAIRSVRGASGPAYLRRLLFSRDEAEAILAVAPQPSGLKALDFRANRALAMGDELREYRVIHFATHGLLDSQRPELSGLVLSLVDEAGRPQDGFLRLHEIYNLRLNAELIVLSACQTGLGKEVRGEGLVGLTRGFMYAGAPRVVASLWQVDDAATSALMKRFYRGMMQEQLPPAAALRAAQLEMLKRKQWQSPYFWGAFVLQGEWK